MLKTSLFLRTLVHWYSDTHVFTKPLQISGDGTQGKFLSGVKLA